MISEMASVQEVGQGKTGPATDISEDDLYEVLANRRRRFAVHLLKREPEDSVEIGEMAERIAAWENDVEVAEITGSDRKRVYTALQQSHLPKMDDAGVVEFDKDRGTVEPTATLEGVDLYMDVVEGREIPGVSTTSGSRASPSRSRLRCGRARGRSRYSHRWRGRWRSPSRSRSRRPRTTTTAARCGSVAETTRRRCASMRSTASESDAVDTGLRRVPIMTQFNRARVVQAEPEAGPSPHYYVGMTCITGERVTLTVDNPEI